jgi:peptidoglycan/xylan/chitin deacetylase (PgdA/CDA1 family)
MALAVALTFDAEHPDRTSVDGAAAAVIDALETSGVRATFFLQGRWVQAQKLLARRILDGGHLIGSHSHYHARMPLFSPAGFATDVRAAEWAIRQGLGVSPRPWFRFPFGSGARDRRLISRLAELGYRHVGWHVEPREWRGRESPTSVASAIVDATLAHGDGAIVLLHTWPRPVAEALQLAIPQLQAEGATLVRVDELELPAGLEPIADPRPAA